jgi:hypothetical protein
MLGVECKNRGYTKSLLKEILGVRRELSLLTDVSVSTQFNTWPEAAIRADPPSCLLVYSSDNAVKYYKSPGDLFSIRFEYDPP